MGRRLSWIVCACVFLTLSSPVWSDNLETMTREQAVQLVEKEKQASCNKANSDTVRGKHAYNVGVLYLLNPEIHDPKEGVRWLQETMKLRRLRQFRLYPSGPIGL